MNRPRTLTASSFLSKYGNNDELGTIESDAPSSYTSNIYDGVPVASPNAASSTSQMALSPSQLFLYPHLVHTSLASSAPAPDYISSPLELKSPLTSSERSPSPMSPAARFLSSPAMSLQSLDGATTSSSQEEQSHEEIFVPGYDLGSTIGMGGSSIIKRAESHSPGASSVAIKIVHLGGHLGQARRQIRELRREAEIWTSLSHQHILPLFSSSFSAGNQHTPYTTSVYFVTLYCPAGSLFDILNRSVGPWDSLSPTRGRPQSFRMPQDDAGTIFRQIVRGLRYLHEEKRLVHGDIKLENVLIDDSGVCKIADFGMARWMDRRRRGSHAARDVSTREDTNNQSCSSSSSSSEDNGEDHELVIEPAHKEAAPGHSLTSHASLRGRVALHHRSRHGSTPSAGPSSYALKHTQSLHNRRRAKAHKCNFPRGSLPYASPELLEPSYISPFASAQQKSRRRPNPAQDVWALGVLLYFLLAGKFPFNDSYEPRLVDKIVRGTFRQPENIGKDAEDMLSGCMSLNVDTRWRIALVDENAWVVGWGDRASSSVAHTPSNQGRSTNFRVPAGPHGPSPSPLQATMPGRYTLLEDANENKALASSEDANERGRSTRVDAAAARVRLRDRPPSKPAPLPPRDRDSSRSRSTSRPPFIGHFSSSSLVTLHGERDAHAPALEPVTTRISVSVERGRKTTVKSAEPGNTLSPSRSPSPSMPPVTPSDIDEFAPGQGHGRGGRKARFELELARHSESQELDLAEN